MRPLDYLGAATPPGGETAQEGDLDRLPLCPDFLSGTGLPGKEQHSHLDRIWAPCCSLRDSKKTQKP
jgi:hypothetical protein